MTDQQKPERVDELFRQAFEQLPDGPASSGWDKPSDRVWQNIQADMAKTQKGWSMQAILLLGAMALLIAAGIYWTISRPEPSAPNPVIPTSVEQITPSAQENLPAKAADSTPVESKNKPGIDPKKPAKQTNTSAPASKTLDNAAQPLPGSKTTLPPNTTEANKQQR
ncbi:MAG: hypothetical protein IT261_06160 [Saprospiraceae bacterium]|nr:hypothetical protein [Saprospiraceae bacterium]